MAKRTTTNLCLLCVLSAALGLGGCWRGESASLETFKADWHSAINSGESRQLFHLLDAASRRLIERDIESLRGLSPDVQQSIINQLGGYAVEDLSQVPGDLYFALLWDRITGGRRPTMKIEADGAGSAAMIVSLGDGRSQRLMLAVEGGQWVWRLPEQSFERAGRRIVASAAQR